MTAYAESNFVLEYALEQEQCESCEEILRIAEARLIEFVLPAFSLTEPHEALVRKAKSRSKLSNDLQMQLSELGRSRPYRQVPGDFGGLAAVLVRSSALERSRLRSTVATLINAAQVIPLDASVIRSASEIQVEYGMSGQDAIVFASVAAHLRDTQPRDSCFLNRNTKDFDNPAVQYLLRTLGCRLIARFDEGLRYIQSRLNPTSG